MAKLEYCNGIAALKDKKGIFRSVTPAFAELYHYPAPQSLRNLSEFQIADYALDTPYYSGHKVAQDFISEDEIALRGKRFFVFTVEVVHNELVAAITYKKPFIENNKITGIAFQMELISDLTKPVVYSYLNNPNITISEHTKKFLDIYQLAPARKYNLTQREKECIQYLVNGASAKDIALTLGISHRTVEYYIHNIKEKFGVNKTLEIAIKAISENII